MKELCFSFIRSMKIWAYTIIPVFISALIIPSYSMAKSESLDGLWIQDCSSGVIRTEQFTSSEARLTESFYSDKSCSSPQFKLISQGTYFTQDEKIDFSFVSVSIELHSEVIVSLFNERAVCGFNDWQVNSLRNITGLACDLFGLGTSFQVPPKGLKRFGIYAIMGDQLFFGEMSKEFDSSTPEKRPQYLSPIPYKRR